MNLSLLINLKMMKNLWIVLKINNRIKVKIVIKKLINQIEIEINLAKNINYQVLVLRIILCKMMKIVSMIIIIVIIKIQKEIIKKKDQHRFKMTYKERNLI